MQNSGKLQKRVLLPAGDPRLDVGGMKSVDGPKQLGATTLQSELLDPNAYKGMYWGVMVYFAVSYLRPQDIIRPLRALHPIEILVPLLIIGYLLSNKTAVVTKISPIIKAMLVFAGIMILSIPFSYHQRKSFTGAEYFLLTVVLICFLITVTFNSFRRIERLFLMLNFGIVILALDVVKKYLSGGTHQTIEGLIGGQFGNPNDLAVNLVLFLPMVYYYFLNGKTIFSKLFSLGLFGVVLFGVLGTQSRGGLLAAIVVLGLLIIKTDKKGLALTTGAVAVVLILTLAPSNALNRFQTIFTYQEDTSAMKRTYFYESSIKMLRSRPLTGVGMDAWTYAYATAFRNPLDISYGWYNPHSSYFQIIGELGLPGILTYLYLIYMTFGAMRSLEKRFKVNPVYQRQLYFTQCLRIGFIGFLIATIFQSFTYYCTAYNMMAIVFAMDKIYPGPDKRVSTPPGKPNGKQD